MPINPIPDWSDSYSDSFKGFIGSRYNQANLYGIFGNFSKKTITLTLVRFPMPIFEIYELSGNPLRSSVFSST